MQPERTNTPEEIAARFPHALCAPALTKRPSRLARLLASPVVTRGLHVALFLLNLGIGAFLIELGKGTVPIPDGAMWLVPIIAAVLNGATIFLPRAGSEHIAAQVNLLKANGVPRSQMVVLSEQEAVQRLGEGS